MLISNVSAAHICAPRRQISGLKVPCTSGRICIALGSSCWQDIRCVQQLESRTPQLLKKGKMLHLHHGHRSEARLSGSPGLEAASRNGMTKGCSVAALALSETDSRGQGWMAWGSHPGYTGETHRLARQPEATWVGDPVRKAWDHTLERASVATHACREGSQGERVVTRVQAGMVRRAASIHTGSYPGYQDSRLPFQK